MTILLAEDHQLVRQGMRTLLEKDPRLHICGEASNGLEAVEMVQSLRPDILLLDLTLPRLHGLEVLNQLRDGKRTRTIVVSMHADAASVLESFRLGACGYLLKESPASELIEALKLVHDGGHYVTPSLREMVKAAAFQIARGATNPDSLQLSRRERLVLQFAAEGNPNSAVARLMGISVRTVEKHRSNLMSKLGLRSEADLVLFAIRKQVITA